MHSSRMRTVHCIGRLGDGEGCLPGGEFRLPGGVGVSDLGDVCLEGYLSRGVCLERVCLGDV